MRSVRGLPELRVEVDGVPMAPEELRALESVRVQQHLSLPAQCELTFTDPRGALATRGLPPGTALRISVAARREPLFVGEVTAVEYVHGASGTRQVRVRSYDLLHRLRKRQPVRVHAQVTPRDLARELVSDLGLSVEASEPGPLSHHLIQHGQSDLEFLVEQTERCGLWLVLAEGVLRVLSLDGHGDPVPLVMGESLLEASVEVNGDPACRSVSSAGWNALQGQVYTASPSGGRVGRRVEASVPPERVGGSGERALVNENAEDTAHAEALARAELDHRLAREVVLTGVAEGDPRLRPGTRVDVRGVVPVVAGQYVLTSVTHTLEAQHGFLSELSSAPPPRRTRPRASSVVPGVVSRVDDPDNKGRVRVSLPTCGDVETDWMQVLCAGAGAGKGLVMLPDVGDTVLLVLSGEDPARGVVVGGLYGANGPPDTGVSGAAVRRFNLLTPGGLKLRLNDETQTLRVEDQLGSYLQLSPHVVRLHAETALEIEAPGKSVTIEAATIDFRRRD
ncbi:phage baseplate assembly protein V [Archangium gephyra]|uniref:Phage baseplate assembly protein V n=1 Tax=Archangium gephyra TaxID=48 RepID=A0AAC8QH41_9BACT|nr:phage baseplate assembly protein V [Archangium gephyra]AKJ07346.1 Rhs element Vgr protein [Archangium gephyra]REG26747.1 phage baseplate assembly protein V [Archangium gephyra]